MPRRPRCNRFVLRLGLMGLLGAVACAMPIRTEHDSAPGVDFSRFESYAWISSKPLIPANVGVLEARYVSPIDEQRIRAAVDSELAARGYRSVEQARADLVVSFAVGREEKLGVQDMGGRDRVYYHGYGHGDWYRGSAVQVRTYTEGTLVLEIFERASQQAVWVGWASKRLSPADDREEVLQRAIAKILAPFPARPGVEPAGSD
jgi:hypothetical protein